MNELISIIIPIYEVELYLKDCLDSIVGQTYKNLEIILVDDGSPDNCGTICDRYAQKDSRIRVIHQDNVGLSEARNNAMSIMTGDYFAFVDSDDIIHPSYIETLHCLIHEFNTDISMCGLIEFYDGDSVTCQNNMSNNISVLSEFEFASSLLKGHTLPYTVVWDKLYRTSKFGDLRFKTGRKSEDSIFLADYLLIGATCSRIDTPLYMYRRRQNSLTSSKDFSYVQDCSKTWIYQYNIVKDRYGSDYRSKLFVMVLKRISRLATDVYWNYNKHQAKNLYLIWLDFYTSNNQKIQNKKENVKIQLFKYFPILYYHIMKKKIYSIF